VSLDAVKLFDTMLHVKKSFWASAQIEAAAWKAELTDWTCEQPSLSQLPTGLRQPQSHWSPHVKP